MSFGKSLRKLALGALAVSSFVMAVTVLPVAAQKKPNILVIMGDDVGWFNIGAYHRGMMSGKTPNLDKLAAQGMMFTDYYAEASCTAGRANFITGELPIRTGLTTVGQAGADVGMPDQAATIALALKPLGYETYQFGKNHLGDLNKYLPCLHKAQHSARKSWIFINGEYLNAIRTDIGGDPKEPWVNIAWKFVWTAKDSWLGPNQNTGSIPAAYNLTMDPYEKYDMVFNGAAPTRALSNSPGKYSGQDNGWTAALFSEALLEFDKSIMKYPSIQRSPGGASNDLVPDLQHPKNPVPALDPNNMPKAISSD